MSAFEGERIAKLIARAGVCSRREAEALIAAGRVQIDSETLQSAAVNVRPGQTIKIDGEVLRETEPTRLFRLNKPRGIVTSAHDPEGRKTIYDLLPAELPRLMPVGRLDLTTEGLLLLTNDGGLKRFLELPSTGWLRRYRVRAYGRVEQAALDELKDGVAIDGVNYGGVEARVDRVQGHNVWLSMGLREGKNREIRNILESLDLQVNRLIRIAYGPFQLGALKDREVEEVTGKVLKEQLGTKYPLLEGRSASGRHRRRPA